MDGACFFKPADMIPELKPLYNSFLNDFLTVGDRHQRGIETVTFYGKCGILRDIVFPGQGLDMLKQRVKSVGMKTAHLNEDALSDAQ